jgi:hypothetical protein
MKHMKRSEILRGLTESERESVLDTIKDDEHVEIATREEVRSNCETHYGHEMTEDEAIECISREYEHARIDGG